MELQRVQDLASSEETETSETSQDNTSDRAGIRSAARDLRTQKPGHEYMTTSSS